MAIYPKFDKGRFILARVAAEASGYPISVIRRAVAFKLLEGERPAYELNTGRIGHCCIVSRESLKKLLLGEIDISRAYTPVKAEHHVPPSTLEEACEQIAGIHDTLSQLLAQNAEIMDRIKRDNMDALQEPSEVNNVR